MYCKKCGAKIEEVKSEFCRYCGEKIDQKTIVINNDENKKGQTFLIIGIVLAFCFSLAFGAAIILLNEFRYKPQLQDAKNQEANQTKNIMIILAIIGIILRILIVGLSYFVNFIE